MTEQQEKKDEDVTTIEMNVGDSAIVFKADSNIHTFLPKGQGPVTDSTMMCTVAMLLFSDRNEDLFEMILERMNQDFKKLLDEEPKES